jgi:hypothetical protein
MGILLVVKRLDEGEKNRRARELMRVCLKRKGKEKKEEERRGRWAPF